MLTSRRTRLTSPRTVTGQSRTALVGPRSLGGPCPHSGGRVWRRNPIPRGCKEVAHAGSESHNRTVSPGTARAWDVPGANWSRLNLDRLQKRGIPMRP